MVSVASAALALVVAIAPASTPSGEPQTPPQRNVPTVSLDPEHPFPIVGWWSNGREMLDVAEDGAYRLYDSQNRYRKPIEVGRWHRQNHAAFWLEPYTMRKEERTRVPLSIVEGSVAISVRTFGSMTALETPPFAAEDLFIGLWAGAGGSLDLQPSMRYHYVAPRRAVEGQPVVISSHRGAWRLREGKVELLPDSPSVTAMLLEPIAPAIPDAPNPPKGTPNAPPSVKPNQSGAAGAAETRKAAEDDAPLIRTLRCVEGTLERVITRPAVAPNGTQETPTSAPPGPSGEAPAGRAS
jgi:hypothetical protein